mmetsp:Transcript_175/g.368  ORF Transcript_175/g.368 Transcript_175/m.368 type:complete len:389 (+) Transcript_175:55-1221(+)
MVQFAGTVTEVAVASKHSETPSPKSKSNVRRTCPAELKQLNTTDTTGRGPDGQVRWRSGHSIRMSWANLAAQEIVVSERPSSRTSTRSRSTTSSVRSPPSRASPSGLSNSPLYSSSPSDYNGVSTPKATAKSAARLAPTKSEPNLAVAQTAEPGKPRRDSIWEKVDQIVELSRIAKRLHIPQDCVRQAAQIMKECADADGESIREWRMSKAQFTKALCRLTNKASEKELPRRLASEAFKIADIDETGVLDFGKFAFWLSTNSFSEDINCDEEEREIRSLARKHGLALYQVEKCRRDFKEFDADASGAIDRGEFEDVVYKSAKVPKDIGLPQSRVQQWWRDADADNNGTVDFEEFLIFQKKYGDRPQESSQQNAFQEFYRTLRRPSNEG